METYKVKIVPHNKADLQKAKLVEKILESQFREYDPIEEFIGAQLRSLSCLDTPILKKAKGKKLLGLWPYEHHKESRSTRNTHEDQLLDAIDRKYRKGRRRQERVLELLEKGYTQTEIAPLLGVHYSTVKRDVKKIKRRLKLWKKSSES